MDRMDRVKQHAPLAAKITGAVFAVLGLLVCVRWVAGWTMAAGEDDFSGPCSSPSLEGCPWKHVFADLSNRLHLLELAFKADSWFEKYAAETDGEEQVIARESIVQEVHNQTDVNMLLNRKLLQFMHRLEEVDARFRLLEDRISELTSRLHSDESVGFLVIVLIIVEIMLRVQPRIQELVHRRRSLLPAQHALRQIGNEVKDAGKDAVTQAKATSENGKEAESMFRSLIPIRWLAKKSAPTTEAPPTILPPKQNCKAPLNGKNGVNFSPKHGLSLKNELCLVVFNKENNNIVTTLIESVLKHLEDVKLSAKPHYTIEGYESFRQMPRARLYLVVTEMELKGGNAPGHSVTSHFSRQDCELHLSVVRYIKSLGAQSILIVANDEGSKKLTAHALYNNGLRFLQSHDAMQELVSSGRIFSIWKELTSHQLSHLRKIIKGVLIPQKMAVRRNGAPPTVIL